MPKLGNPIICLVLTLIITGVVYMAAREIRNGTYKEPTGRRSGQMKILAAIGRSLGPEGTLAVGGAIGLGTIGWLVLVIRKRNQLIASGYVPEPEPEE